MQKMSMHFEMNQITKTDEMKELNLSMYHYASCSLEDSDAHKRMRGAIVASDGTTISTTFGFTPEFVDTEFDKASKYFESIGVSNDSMAKGLVECFDSHEGCLIRCIFYKGEWLVTTHKKLRAFNSRWSSRFSFGEIFSKSLLNEFYINKGFNSLMLEMNPSLKDMKDELELEKTIYQTFLNSLDKKCQHLFLTKNNYENYIVCDPPEYETVYYVGSFGEDRKPYFDKTIQIGRPMKYEFKSIEELFSHVKQIDVFRMQGIIVYMPNGTLCKIVNSEYRDWLAVRNNEPSIRMRYLSLRTDTNNAELINKLSYLYPHFVSKFDHMEYTITLIVNNIYKAYIDRYIKNKHTVMPKEEFKIMKECNEWCNQDSRRKISRRVISQFLNKMAPYNLNMMIKRYIAEKFNQQQAPV